ncbi:group 1 glycosyl transferase [Actinomadura craniellae]|uniref:Group 1 glycosyl transferase n=1 Tax=Actinomadura craniellae TaxID=2231787 RepID=A0A365HC66_9ACTN|nr:glycosyltransferase [Actinomadura craniellae]RAY16629.1 group 1 glycosyl transferase [Actinomadura craniellae]
MPVSLAPLHIALVSTSLGRVEDTQSLHVVELARELGRQGHRVSLYTRRHDDAARDRTRLGQGATIHYLTAGPARPLRDDEVLPYLREFGTELARRLAGTRPDLVHAHGWTGGLAAHAAVEGTGLPLVQSFHGLGIAARRDGLAPHPARERLERVLGRTADTIHACSADEADDLVRMGVPRRAIRTVPYAVDGERFRETGPTMPRGDRARLVAVCSDLACGGLDTAIRALVHVPDAELVIAGGPSRDDLENDPVVHRLRLLAKEVHVDDRVIFLGRLPRKDVPKLLRSARLALSLAPHRPSALAALEAMACGVPVVATPVGGNADTVLDGVTGLHVPARRPAQIGRAIRRLLAEPTTVAGFAIAAADRAHSRYSVERIAAETARAYARLLPDPEPEVEVDGETDVDAPREPVGATA